MAQRRRSGPLAAACYPQVEPVLLVACPTGADYQIGTAGRGAAIRWGRPEDSGSRSERVRLFVVVGCTKYSTVYCEGRTDR
jgi:hypothetical protein